MYLIDLILHLDKHLATFIAHYGYWVYGLLFLIIFVETGLVVMPFLPGDNLLFAAGALAAIGSLNLALVCVVLGLAAILGDSTNYFIGRKFGIQLFKEGRKYPSLSHLQQAQAFFEKHGGKSVAIGRFFPFIRTFTPFVAGMSDMPYLRFLAFSAIGTLLWVGTIVSAGYFLGQLAFVKNNLTFIIIGIIFISLTPIFIQSYKQFKNKTL